MTDKELRKLKRNELLQMLLEQSKTVEALKAEIEEKNKLLEEKNIKLAESGSIAEAAIKLNGVFEAAQAAADQYLYNIKLESDKNNIENKNQTEDKINTEDKGNIEDTENKSNAEETENTEENKNSIEETENKNNTEETENLEDNKNIVHKAILNIKTILMSIKTILNKYMNK